MQELYSKREQSYLMGGFIFKHMSLFSLTTSTKNIHDPSFGLGKKLDQITVQSNGLFTTVVCSGCLFQGGLWLGHLK